MALKARTLMTLTSGLACLSGPAHAETDVKPSGEVKPVISKTTYWRKTAVPPTENDDNASLIHVVNDKGKPFYNHMRSAKHLAKTRSDFDVVETYRITYKGRTYTNTITKGGK